MPSDLPDLAPGLRLVHAAGAGTEWFDHDGLPAIGHPALQRLGRGGGARSPSSCWPASSRSTRTCAGSRRSSGSTAGSLSTVASWPARRWVIVGLGGIGRAIAVRARAFAVTVLGTRRSARPGDTDPDVDELWPLDRLDEMLGRCDVVLLSAPAGPETDDLFDADRFAAMKPGSLFCNVARGSLVVEPALIDALAPRPAVGRRPRRRPPRAGPARRPAVGRAEPLPLTPLLVVDGPLRRSA